MITVASLCLCASLLVCRAPNTARRLAFLLDFKWLLWTLMTLNILSEHAHPLINIYFVLQCVQYNSKLKMLWARLVCGCFTSMRPAFPLYLILLFIQFAVCHSYSELAPNDTDTKRRWIKLNPTVTESSWLLDNKRSCVCLCSAGCHMQAKSQHKRPNNWKLL